MFSSIASKCCEKYPILKVSPKISSPLSNDSCCIIILNNVVLPAPLSPTIPILAVLKTFKLKFLNIILSPKLLEPFFISIIVLPKYFDTESNSKPLRSLNLIFDSSLKRSIRYFCFVRLASTPL